LPSFKQRAESQGLKVVAYPALRYHLLMYDREGVFKDVRVRQAMCHAINRPEIFQGQFNGLGKEAAQRFEPGQPGHAPDVTGYSYDLDKAKALMAEAGNPKIAITFPVFEPVKALGELVKSQLEAIGFSVNLEVMSTPQFFSIYQSSKYPLIYNTSTSEDPGPYDYYTYRFSRDGVGNPFKVTSPELDQLARTGLNEPDPAKQEAVWKQMTKLIHDQALDCGFFDYYILFAHDPKRVDNVVPTLFQPSVFRYRDAKPVGS
ncbi:MAG: ABC transporter substrate-binding protein, partial [Sporichthyaceae bacterium]|nr:ABC transporter substrate-binding protein [Sporichthyaceae bacterium]